MSYNSTIKPKKCRCGCGRWPKMGYAGYAGKSCMPESLASLPKYNKSNVAKGNRVKLTNISRRVHDAQKEVSSKFEPRSSFKNDSTIPDKGELLALADKLFSQYIKKRDADSLGNVTCPCCGRTFNLKDKDESGEKVVQTLHFVKRGVYVLRHNELNAAAGDKWCNKAMHDFPDEKEYKNFRSFLVDALGEDKVKWMELQKREINKLSAGDLQMVINRYSVKKGKI